MSDSAPILDSPLVVGIDLVQISRIAESLAQFGERFVQRVYREQEAAYAAQAPALRAERLAARFAAKEATVKAFDLSEHGINLRDIEVVKLASGACALRLHGRVAEVVRQKGFGATALSLSHDGDYATAVVTALRGEPVPAAAAIAPTVF